MATMTEYEKMQEELKHYKMLFGTGDVATKGYKSIVRILEQQIIFLDDFDIKDNIGTDPKFNPKYERALKIFREMPEVIMALKELKDKLGIEYVEKVERVQATTPQSIGLLNKGSV
jgi:hypothetical protein